MAKCEWVIICERAIIEETAKTVSLMSIIENLALSAPPPGFLKQGQQPGPLVP